MSAWILTAGKLVFALMGLAVGGRLVATMRERGAFGLHTVALGAIGVGGLGMLLMPMAEAIGSWPMLVAAEAGIRGGMLLLCVFVAGTFRPSPIGWIGAALAGAFLVGSIVWDLRAQDPATPYDYALMSSHANQLSIAVPFAWAAFESAVLWRQGRRRLELGLTSPTLVRSYLLWLVACGCFVGVCTLAILAGIVKGAGLDPMLAAAAQTVRGLLYFVIVGAIWAGLFRRAPAVDDPASADAPPA